MTTPPFAENTMATSASRTALLLKIIVCTQVEGFSTNARQAKIEKFLARALIRLSGARVEPSPRRCRYQLARPAPVQFSLGQRDFPAYTAGHGHERAFQDLRRRSPRPGRQRHLEGTAAARLQEFDWPDAPGVGPAGCGGGKRILRGGAAGIRVCGRGQSGR